MLERGIYKDSLTRVFVGLTPVPFERFAACSFLNQTFYSLSNGSLLFLRFSMSLSNGSFRRFSSPYRAVRSFLRLSSPFRGFRTVRNFFSDCLVPFNLPAPRCQILESLESGSVLLSRTLKSLSNGRTSFSDSLVHVVWLVTIS